jgi:DNA ligase D-like protein (predicted ligase)
MLARSAGPFDSEQHLFEIKWDGFRAVVFVEDGAIRLLSRKRNSLATSFPELEVLAALPEGTVLDGEIVILRDGKPDFELLLARGPGRAHTRGDPVLAALSRKSPAAYVAFDLLYEGFEPILDRPLRERRERLEAVIRAAGVSRLALSEGVTGAGKSLFRSAVERELEGVVAKDLDSLYTPGRRSDAWVKIKRRQRAYCLVLGYLPRDDRDFQSLLVALEDGGRLRYVGRVGGGMGDLERERIHGLLRARVTDRPLVPCDEKGIWVKPGLYCEVSFLERTHAGTLRAPVFERLLPVEPGEGAG